MSYAQQLHAEHKARKRRLGMTRKVVKELNELLAEQSELVAEIKESAAKVPEVVSEWIKHQMSAAASIKAAVRRGDDTRFSVLEIQTVVAKHFGVTRGELMCKRRTAGLALARHVAFYLCKQITLRSFPEIGRRFGGRDHTTIMHGIKKIERMIAEGHEVASDIEQIKARLS